MLFVLIIYDITLAILIFVYGLRLNRQYFVARTFTCALQKSQKLFDMLKLLLKGR